MEEEVYGVWEVGSGDGRLCMREYMYAYVHEGKMDFSSWVTHIQYMTHSTQST